jgi:hypothetical protein
MTVFRNSTVAARMKETDVKDNGSEDDDKEGRK